VVSRRVNYTWSCPGCGGTQEAPVWRLLDVRERGDVVEKPGPGLAWVVCPQCGTVAEIDAPLLLIRPGNPLPLLLAVHIRELGGPPLAPPSGPVLEQEARAALGANTAGITAPLIPLPRILLPLALVRDVESDVADPGRAIQKVFGQENTLIASWYREFLRIVRDSEPERRLALAFNELWSVPPHELEAFISEHPVLSTANAVMAAKADLDRLPSDRQDDLDLTQFRMILQARLDLLKSIARGDPVPEAVREYLAQLERAGESVNSQLAQLLQAVNTNPGMSGVPLLREALEMAAYLHYEDLEADLSADLGARVLSQPVTNDANIEESIRLLERALSLIPEDDRRWPNVAGNLGNAYHRRISGDAVENWETARSLIQRACDASDRETDPPVWAANQTNYGFLLGERPGGSSKEDFSRGIDHIRAGLEERSPERNVVDWAFSLLNLGLLHQRRGAVGDNLVAMDCYEQALARLRPEDELQLWTTLKNNRADLLLAMDSPDLEDAEATVRSALAEVNTTADPIQVGRLTWQLARIADRRTGPLTTEAVGFRRDALRMLDPRLAPALHLRIGGELVDAYYQLNDWSAVAAVYTNMLTAHDSLYDVQTSSEGRRMVLAQYPRLARWAAYVFARVGRPGDAVEVIERGRARQLSVAVSRDTADLARLVAVDQALADRYDAALARYRAALGEAYVALPRPGMGKQISDAERNMQQIISEIREIPGFERFLQPMAVADIYSAAGGQPITYLISAPAGSYVLTVQSDPEGEPKVTSVSVPEVTSRDIAHLVLVGEDGAPGLISAQSAGPFASQLLPAALKRLTEIEPLLRPVADTLANAPEQVAVVVPTGLLGLIPLPVAVVDGRILDDIGEVRLVPSAAVYAACRKRATQDRQQHLVGIADPDGTLPGSRVEIAAIRELFEPGSPVSCAVGSDATRAWVLEHVSAASHLHLACHGGSTMTSAVGGVLRLSDDDLLTIDDLLDGRLINCRLAVASACQSGHYATGDVPDEFTGLSAGFLQAGAGCAIVSLWQVRDDITSLFMTRFYELLEPGRPGTQQRPVSALRQARTWLRGLTAQQAQAYKMTHPERSRSQKIPRTSESGALGTIPYSSPENWAAFVAWGY
jgi:CHAT domain-containing protein/tetratricopeptide (TPR) repeat protein